MCALIKESRANNIELLLFISPVHARQLEVIRLSNLYPTFEQWKRDMVKVIAEDVEQHPDKSPIQLWDFSGYNLLTTREQQNIKPKYTKKVIV